MGIPADAAPYGIDLSSDGSGPDVEALRDAVVEAALEWRTARDFAAIDDDGPKGVTARMRASNAQVNLLNAIDALNAALTPTPVNPAAEIAAASRALQAALDRAQKNITPERDRLRAALAREPK